MRCDSRDIAAEEEHQRRRSADVGGTALGGTGRRGWASTALLAAIVVVLVGVPGFAVVRGFVLHAEANAASVAAGVGAGGGGARLELSDAILGAKGPAWGLIWTSLAWAGGITAVATVLGTLAAVWLRGRWARWGPLVFVPMALPNYLAYWAFGQIRAPGTWVGDAIERAISSGQTWVPMFVGRLVAVLGLSLWAWPIVAIAVGAVLARVATDVRDAMRMDVGRGRRAVMELRLAWRGVVGGAALVLLVMMGSAVPLHLAQVPTLSLAAWQVLSLMPGSAAAWAALWPVLLPSLVAAAWLARRVVMAAKRGAIEKDNAVDGRVGSDLTGNGGRGWRSLSVWGVAVLLGLSVPMPMGAMLLTIRDFAVFSRFGWEMGEATNTSLRVALWVGVGCGVITLISARALSRGASRAVSGFHTALVALLVFLVLAPGLLVGSAWTHAFAVGPGTWGLSWLREVGDTQWALILAHLSRFAGLAALAGAGIAWMDARGAREVRAVDGATSAWSWLEAGGALGSAVRGLLGCVWVGLLGGVLSFHEIEATVMVQPPGLTTVAQVVLGYLHFSRLQEMSVAGIYLIGGAMVVAGVAVWGAWLVIRGRVWKELV